MRHGWTYIYEAVPAARRCEELIDHLALDGISLREPVTGRIIRVSSIGEQITSSREDILKECANSSQVNFNLYLAPSDNVFCSIDKLNENVVREGYSLDGKTEEQSKRVIRDLTELFCKRATDGTAFGIVVDRYTELYRDFHWDDFFAGSADVPPEWPMLLGFSKDFDKLRFVPERLYTREDSEKYVVFTRKVAQLLT